MVLQEDGQYDHRARSEVSRELRRLLSYSEEAIKDRRPAAWEH